MEFDLIHRHFATPFSALAQANGGTVIAGIGDDCAALRPAANHVLYVSTDTLVESVHFFTTDVPAVVGWKSLVSNLSDLAACGANPLGFTLNLSLPHVEEAWLASFSSGLLEAAAQYNCPLVGGDTTSAGTNLLKTISITVFGQAVGTHTGFHRSLARADDEVWVSGTPGLARLGLLLEYQCRGQLDRCCEPSSLQRVEALLGVLPEALKNSACQALQRPLPRLELGQRLHGVARACLDLSDGLSGDLLHITKASNLRAVLSLTALQALWLRKWPELSEHIDADSLLETLVFTTLEGGDDFELCWTCPSGQRAAKVAAGVAQSCVGKLEAGEGVWLMQHQDSEPIRLESRSYVHFSQGLT
ncbi:thiamine-phosphate kinase [Limnobacter thiooxidans]|uniref:Thiamine-monophosphate kinase n=1 Tax=Limnobacter thiooxidans TaxID=131080 RepID=A0AA86JIZ7_9BURK|nr:thiamine-phosphate kinase [Limnobacter thiooxidans]BET25267.1 thiamine-phosphate kinase [Limnobacter thiooxidans]